MLETEDIDDDYFTPASSTSLANIFGKPRKEDGTDNETLKYTPPKPAKPEETKATQCIYACVLLGYEWSNGAYVARGKLGFAILKILKTGFYNMVLYDANKTTLSCATISTTFEITIKENIYFSYHDNLQKYWCLNATVEETTKIIDLLKSFNVLVKYSSNKDNGPPVSNTNENAHAVITASIEQEIKEEKGSDTDSSINRKTKMSILNRMANMGQSVLPPRNISTEKTSDSSDTNDSSHYKTIRHKPIKSSIKRNSSERNFSECQSLVEAEKIGSSIIEHSTKSIPLFTFVNGQLLPVTNSSVVTSPSNNTSVNDMSYFISEQRVSNSEIRININRMTDKADQILGKLSDLENKDKNNTPSTFQMEVLQKLLTEYENKIKLYEGFVKTQGLDKDFGTQFYGAASKEAASTTNCEDDTADKIKELQKLSAEKDIKIMNLESKLKELQGKIDEIVLTENKKKDELQEEIRSLKQIIDTKNKELIDIKDDDDSTGNKIKNLMNDTFRAISTNFENDKEYSGERVKAVTAKVIKKVTIETLNTL